jgi:ribonuclease P protein subunit POP4
LRNVKPVKENKKTRMRKKVLSSIEKRRLGLHKLPKTGLKYVSFAPLHQLWLEYIENNLGLEMRFVILVLNFQENNLQY